VAETKRIYLFPVIILLSISFIGSKDTFANTIPGNNVSSNLNIKTYDHFITYKNATLGMSIQYPSNWNESYHSYGNHRVDAIRFGIFDRTDTSPYFIVLKFKDLYVNNIHTPSEFTAHAIDFHRGELAFRLIGVPKPTTLADIPAVRILYTSESDYSRVDKMHMMYVTMNNGIGYQLIFVSEPSIYSNYLSIAQKMIHSFKISTSDLSSTGIRLPNSPIFLAVNPATNRIYVSNSASDSISVIDGGSIIDNITVGGFPYSIAVDQDSNLIYVITQRTNTTYVIDGLTNKIVILSRYPRGQFLVL
jgi:YVTN family beta-propeller protein